MSEEAIPPVILRDHIETHIVSVVLTILMLLLVARVLSKQRRPSTSLAWILAIILVPYVGIPFYIVFGGRKFRSVSRRKHRLHVTPREARVRLLEFDHPAEDVLTSEGVRPPSRHNRIEFVSTGEDAFARLCRMIEQARSSIYIQTYILQRDAVGRALVGLLAKKAAEGVDVRLLLDSYGSLGVTRWFLGPLLRAGGRAAWFLPMLPVRRNWSLNLRNHRKIVVVDGARASLGGMNLGGEYMGATPEAGRWLDTAVEIEGPAVKDVLEIFCSDWNFASAAAIDLSCAQAVATGVAGASDIAQVAASGPDVDGDPLYEAVLASIHAARERIWMVTPYFAPGEELFRALLIQARIGRDVRLIMPMKSNHPMADFARGPFLRQLAEAGGKVYLVRAPMVHAKNMLFDDKTAVTGSCNFDLRSLYLNFEVALFAYNRERVLEIARWMETLMPDAEMLDPTPPKRLQLWAEQLSFLVSPLL
jgi:cardiolipin synthase